MLYIVQLALEKGSLDMEVWVKFCISRIPLNLKDFVRKALWKKLPVGTRLSKWMPTALHCPLDGAVETTDHTLSTCRFLPVAKNTISKCFLPLSIDGVTVSSVQDLMSSYLDTTFEVPAGIMAWLAIMVNWECRCIARTKVPTWHQFMHLWISSLTTWTKLPHPPVPVNDISLFAKSLSSLLNEGKLVHPNLNPAPPTPPISKAQRRQQNKLDRAMRDSAKLEALICELEDQGFHIIYTDGSSEKVAKIGYVGGYGIYAPGLHAIGAHLPPGLRQTNNTAELYAAIQAIKLFPSGKIAICTDSSLAFLGATGKAKKWELNNWVGSNGPLSNVELWKQLLAELDKSDREIQWIKVPSHVGIVGNEEADALAETGRLSSPLLIQSCVPTARHIRRSVPPQRITVRCSTEPNRQDHNPIVMQKCRACANPRRTR